MRFPPNQREVMTGHWHGHRDILNIRISHIYFTSLAIYKNFHKLQQRKAHNHFSWFQLLMSTSNAAWASALSMKRISYLSACCSAPAVVFFCSVCTFNCASEASVNIFTVYEPAASGCLHIEKYVWKHQNQQRRRAPALRGRWRLPASVF